MTLDVIATSPQAAHEACREAWHVTKELTQAGKQVRIQAGEAEDDRSLEQNRFYWGVLLKALADNAVNGQRYSAEAWHIQMRRQFLGYRFKAVLLPGKKRKSVTRELRSTRDLTVKQFATYLEQITAFAATDLGITIEQSDRNRE